MATKSQIKTITDISTHPATVISGVKDGLEGGTSNMLTAIGSGKGDVFNYRHVWFKVDAARTLDLAEVTISEAITALPELQGFGNVHSLHTAMALDNGRRMCRNNSFVRHAFSLMLLLGCIFISIQNAIAGDSLTSKSNDFRENRIVPILIRANLCTSRQDCRNKEILLCSSSSTATSCDFYGITDEKIMKEIIVEIMYSNTLIKSVFFYRNTKKNTGFFENSIMMYSDKLTGDK